MKRRKFFQVSSLSVAGLGLAASCSNSNSSSESELTKNNAPLKAPDYRQNIKTKFPTTNQKSANDTVVLALIGAGGHGTKLTLDTTELNINTKFKYVCDVDDTRGGRAISELKKIQGFEPIRVKDMRKIFDDKEVDGVIIATPGHWHALATIWACQAGKDVYVEKCISHDIYEGQQMIKAAMKYDRIVQCGMQNRSADYILKARDYIKSGELGEIVAVHVKGLYPGPIPFNLKEDTPAPDTLDWDMWLGPAPKVPYNVSRNKSWLYYWDYAAGGSMVDLIHQLDMARLVMDNPGLPKSVYSAGGRYFFDDNRDVPDYMMTTFDFGDHVWTLQVGDVAPYMKKSGPDVRFTEKFPDWKQNSTRVEIIGTKRMMYVGRMGGGWQVFDKDGEIAAQETGYYPLKPHLQNFVDCVRSRDLPNGNIVEGHKSSVLVHLANLAYRMDNKQLLFSPEYEAILNDAKAQELTKREYRSGFKITDEV